MRRVAKTENEVLRSKIPGKVKTLRSSPGAFIDRLGVNSSVTRFMESHRGFLPELQCFAYVIVGRTDVNARHDFIHIDSWSSFSVPQPAISFKSDATTMYRPVFAGLQGSELLSVSYNDFSDLTLTSFLWDLYSSQFTTEGFLIRGSETPELKVSYVFYDFYNSTDKSKFSSLWEVEFVGVVLREPQATGFSQSMGTLSRSFSFLYDRYSIKVPNLDIK